MRSPAQYIPTEDLVFVGEGFARQWQECHMAREGYAFIIPYPDDPGWPYVEVYFSARPFTRRELRQLCQYDYTPLQKRAGRGEATLGYKWLVQEVQLDPVTRQGVAIVAPLEGVVWTKT